MTSLLPISIMMRLCDKAGITLGQNIVERDGQEKAHLSKWGEKKRMNTNSQEQMRTREGSRPVSAEQRLKELGIKLPAPPEPFGIYAEAVQTGNLLFLSGMLPTEGYGAKLIGRVGAELDVEAGREAAHLAALNVLAVARQYLGSLDKVTRIVRLGVSVAASEDVRDQPKVADAASELLQDVFGKDKNLAAWFM